MRALDTLALLLVIIGAVNWGLIGLFGFDLVAALFAGSGEFGTINGLSRIVYGLVGLCGLYALSFLGRNRYRDID
jgi:uncharacterized protein